MPISDFQPQFSMSKIIQIFLNRKGVHETHHDLESGGRNERG